MGIKELRKEKKLTQVQASEITGIPLRTFKLYENDPDRIGSLKYNYILDELEEYGKVDEEHGILGLDDIKELCTEIFKKYKVNYAILFGSYARGDAGVTSDVDLLVSTETTGLKFFGMVEELRKSLKKKVDVLDINQLADNKDLTENILREGVRIYVQE